MAMKFAQGRYTPRNPAKYVGTKIPKYRSSWELNFMQFVDTNPHILKWASEAISIPYVNPLTEKQTVYIPDFFIQYSNKFNQIVNELIEIKPANQQLLEKVGKNRQNQEQFIKNQAKWAAAQRYCAQNNLTFRILNENDIFHNGNAPTRKK
jgi:hypothetical protein